MSMEDIEIENIDRAERLLEEKHGELPKSLTSQLNKIREDLSNYEIGQVLLDRISDVMYNIPTLSDIKKVEQQVKHLSDTFWHQMEE